MARAALPISSFTLADGTALSNGYVLVKLNRDAQTSNTQVCASIVVRLTLDMNGVPIGSPTFPTNGSLNPRGTIYLLSAYQENGALVFENLPVVVSSPSGTGFGLAFGSTFGS